MSESPLRLIAPDITKFTVEGVDIRETFIWLELAYNARGVKEIRTSVVSTDMGASIGPNNGRVCRVTIMCRTREEEVVVVHDDYVLDHVCVVNGPGGITEELYLRRHIAERVIDDNAIYHQE